MITWFSTNINPPKADREIIARNPLKPIGFKSSAKQCRVIKFHHSFSEERIVQDMLEDNFSLWAYCDGMTSEQYEADVNADHNTSEQFNGKV